FRVARAAAIARLGGDDAKQKLRGLEKGIDKFTPEEQVTLWEGLGNAYQRLHRPTNDRELNHADFEEVRRCYMKLVETRPDELFPWENMFDLAITYHEAEAAEDAAEHIRKITGFSNPSYKYCVASEIIEQVMTRRADVSRLDDARKLVDEALRVRPDWHRLYRLAGEIDDLQNHAEAAVDNYKKSQELGGSNANTARRLVVLLYNLGRMQEVQDAIKLVGRGNSNPMLDKIDIETAFRTGDHEEALKKAKEMVAANPDDEAAHVFYGQLLDVDGPTDEAEQEFRAALKLKPEASKVWLLLVAHLVNADRAEAAASKKAEAEKPAAEKPADDDAKAKDKPKKKAGQVASKKADDKKADEKKADEKSAKMQAAEEAIAEAQKSIPEDQLDSFLWQAYEMTGDIPQSEKYLLAWRDKNPENLALERAIASFYLKHSMADKARAQIEQILAPRSGVDDMALNATRAWGRRALAQMLARQGNYADVQRAIELVEQNSPDGQGPAADDLRLIAKILASRPETKSRERAIELFEQLADQQQLDVRERLALAMLYNRMGKWPKCREELQSLYVRTPKSSGVLGNLVRLLIEHDELDSLDKWMEKLEDAAPATKSPEGNVTVRMKTLWLVKQNKTDEAIEFLKSLTPETIDKESLPRLGLLVGEFEEVKDYDDAEKLMRAWYDYDSTQSLALASFLGRRGKAEEAFEILDSAREKQPLLIVCSAGLDVIRSNPGKVSDPQKEQLDKWLSLAADATKDQSELAKIKILQVEMLDLHGRYADSIKTYRSLLDDPGLSDQQRAIVQNNLAFMLATRGNAKEVAEAEKLVEKAIAQLGPVGSVLDTRGMIYLIGGKSKQALADFKNAVDEAPTAVNFFHLALAEDKLGNAAGSKEALAKAEELKLDLKQLSPVEKKDYNRLQKSSTKSGKG
ncbi:MAG TPA: tetratricopeptide repeat protein, partial [Pirellulales bacterium]|nr:tetratricopeptide repeat protein [Pirellulales bacterium]